MVDNCGLQLVAEQKRVNYDVNSEAMPGGGDWEESYGQIIHSVCICYQFMVHEMLHILQNKSI